MGEKTYCEKCAPSEAEKSTLLQAGTASDDQNRTVVEDGRIKAEKAVLEEKKEPEADVTVAADQLTIDITAEREGAVPGMQPAAAKGFARSQGVAVEDLVARETERGRYVFAVRTVEARPAPEILQSVLPALIRGIPFPKSMYWREPSLRFARPIRRILALLGNEVIDFELDSLRSGSQTEGHPFLAPGAIKITGADIAELKSKLRDAFVIVDRDERRAKILDEIQQALACHGGGLREEELLDEVSDLVEWPEVLEGSFSEGSPSYQVNEC